MCHLLPLIASTHAFVPCYDKSQQTAIWLIERIKEAHTSGFIHLKNIRLSN